MTLGFNVGAIISLGDMETALDYLHNEEMFRPEIDDYVAEKSMKAQEEPRETQEWPGHVTIDTPSVFGAKETENTGGAEHDVADVLLVADGRQPGSEERAEGSSEAVPEEPEEPVEDDTSVFLEDDEDPELYESQGLTEQAQEKPVEQAVEFYEPTESVFEHAEILVEQKPDEPKPVESGPAELTEPKAEFKPQHVAPRPQQVRLTQAPPQRVQRAPQQAPQQVPQRPVQQRPQARPTQQVRPVQQRPAPQTRPQQRPTQQVRPQQRQTPQRPTQAPNKFQEYDGMTATALWNEVRQWIDSQGLAKKLISVAELEDNFGKNSIKRLTSQGYLISLGGGTVAIGR